MSKRTRSTTPSALWTLVKTLAQAAVFWSLFLGILPWAIDSLEPAFALDRLRFGSSANRAVGMLLLVFSSVLGLVSAVTMARVGRGTPLPLDPATNLVVTGPYGYIRNPMAVAGLGQGLGVALWLGSPGTVIYVVCGMVLWNFIVRRWEEADLSQRFGDPYREYREAVRCWIPRWSPYRPSRGSIEQAVPQVSDTR